MKNENSKIIWTAVIVAIIVALISSFVTMQMTGNTIKVATSRLGTEVYTKAEVDSMFRSLGPASSWGNLTMVDYYNLKALQDLNGGVRMEIRQQIEQALSCTNYDLNCDNMLSELDSKVVMDWVAGIGINTRNLSATDIMNQKNLCPKRIDVLLGYWQKSPIFDATTLQDFSNKLSYCINTWNIKFV